MFITKLFRISSQSLQIFSVIGGLKFRFEFLNVFKYKIFKIDVHSSDPHPPPFLFKGGGDLILLPPPDGGGGG